MLSTNHSIYSSPSRRHQYHHWLHLRRILSNASIVSHFPIVSYNFEASHSLHSRGFPEHKLVPCAVEMSTILRSPTDYHPNYVHYNDDVRRVGISASPPPATVVIPVSYLISRGKWHIQILYHCPLLPDMESNNERLVSIGYWNVVYRMLCKHVCNTLQDILLSILKLLASAVSSSELRPYHYQAAQLLYEVPMEMMCYKAMCNAVQSGASPRYGLRIFASDGPFLLWGVWFASNRARSTQICPRTHERISHRIPEALLLASSLR